MSIGGKEFQRSKRGNYERLMVRDTDQIAGLTSLSCQSPQRCEAFLGRDLAHRGAAHRGVLTLQGLSDIADRVAGPSSRNDLLHGTNFDWLGTLSRTGKKVGDQTVASPAVECCQSPRDWACPN